MRCSAIIALFILFASPAALAADARPRFDGQRLFTTAAQREHLDALRAGKPLPERPPDDRRQTLAPPPEEKPLEEKPPSVALQGFVRRTHGRNVVWANGQSTLSGERLSEDIRIDSGYIAGSSVVITLPNGRSLRLEPGQIWDADSGRTVDGFRH